MCLSEGGHEDYTRLARAMDDERLRQLDCYYRNELGLAANTAEMALHSIVICELDQTSRTHSPFQALALALQPPWSLRGDDQTMASTAGPVELLAPACD